MNCVCVHVATSIGKIQRTILERGKYSYIYLDIKTYYSHIKAKRFMQSAQGIKKLLFRA